MDPARWEEVRSVAVKLEKIHARSPEACRELGDLVACLLEPSAAGEEGERKSQMTDKSLLSVY